MALGEILGKDLVILEDQLNGQSPSNFLKGSSDKRELEYMKSEVTRLKKELDMLKRFSDVKV